jgi:hypothetical protein
VLAAVSPEVVIPLLFSLQTKGSYGKAKGIPTIIIAAASFDDIVAISAFGVLLSIVTSTGDCSTSQLSEAQLIYSSVVAYRYMTSGELALLLAVFRFFIHFYFKISSNCWDGT